MNLGLKQYCFSVLLIFSCVNYVFDTKSKFYEDYRHTGEEVKTHVLSFIEEIPEPLFKKLVQNGPLTIVLVLSHL